jgi:endonuclease/exonuclease/phosphatase family metal-dependent hydrolase
MAYRGETPGFAAWIVAIVALLAAPGAWAAGKRLPKSDPIPSQANGSGQVLKILTLNFNNEITGFDDRKTEMRDLRFKAIVDWINTEQPDFVFFQEGWNYHSAPSLAIPVGEATGYDWYYRIGEGFPDLVWDSNAILARKSFHMQDTYVTDLPHSAPWIGDAVNWIVPFGTITKALFATVTLDDGSPLIVSTSHLIAGTDAQRTDQTQAWDALLHDYAFSHGTPWAQANVIFGGDTNSTPDSPEIQYIYQQGYTDAWLSSHPDHYDDEASCTNCGDPYGPRYNPMNMGANQLPAQNTVSPDERIDYIFAHGPEVKVLATTQVFTRPANHMWMSDHFGLVTYIQLGTPTTPSPQPPNPLTDSDELPPLAQEALLEVGDADLSACDHSQNPVECVNWLKPDSVDINGFTLMDTSSRSIHVSISGPGDVWPASSVDLPSSDGASFVFTAAGDYQVSVIDGDADEVRQILHVREAM